MAQDEYAVVRTAPRSPLKTKKRDVIPWGHRGASGYRPENTLSAFEYCMQEYDAEIELDTQISSDGVVYVLHDSSVDRTTNGTGRINSLDSSYLNTLDAGSWYGSPYAGEPLPTLQDALELVGSFPAKRALLDTKNINPPILGAMAEAIKASGVGPERYSLGCWSLGCLREALEYPEFVHTNLITSVPPLAFQFDSYKEVGLDAFHVSSGSISASWVASAQAEGFEVWVWTVNSESSIASACSKGVDGLCGNYPDRLVCE